MSGTTAHKRVAKPHLIVTNGQLTALRDTAVIPESRRLVDSALGFLPWLTSSLNPSISD